MTAKQNNPGDMKIAKERGAAIAKFAKAQVRLLSSDCGALAAGRLFETVGDHGRADQMYSEAIQASADDPEPYARKIINKIKGGGRTGLVLEAQQMLARFGSKTFTNIISNEDLSLYSVLAIAQAAEGDKSSALNSLRLAAMASDRYAAHNLNLLDERALDLPKFIGGGLNVVRMLP